MLDMETIHLSCHAANPHNWTFPFLRAYTRLFETIFSTITTLPYIGVAMIMEFLCRDCPYLFRVIEGGTSFVCGLYAVYYIYCLFSLPFVVLRGMWYTWCMERPAKDAILAFR